MAKENVPVLELVPPELVRQETDWLEAFAPDKTDGGKKEKKEEKKVRGRSRSHAKKLRFKGLSKDLREEFKKEARAKLGSPPPPEHKLDDEGFETLCMCGCGYHCLGPPPPPQHKLDDEGFKTVCLCGCGYHCL